MNESLTSIVVDENQVLDFSKNQSETKSFFTFRKKKNSSKQALASQDIFKEEMGSSQTIQGSLSNRLEKGLSKSSSVDFSGSASEALSRPELMTQSPLSISLENLNLPE